MTMIIKKELKCALNKNSNLSSKISQNKPNLNNLQRVFSQKTKIPRQSIKK
jgi:hypothetical protein